ncbi:MAG: pilus assembly protein TadG-related protein, partial [Ignavibacteriales bacterium]
MAFMRKLRSIVSNERGTSVVLVALLSTALIGMSALVVDVGRMYHTYSQMRVACDAAALAGANQLPDMSAAYDFALTYARANGLTSSEVTITPNYNGDDKKIEVRCARPITFILAPILGFNNKTLHARAVARYGQDRIFDYALFSGSLDQDLAPSGSHMYINGDVHTNRNASFTGSQLIIDGVLEAVGIISKVSTSAYITEEVPHNRYIPIPVYDLAEMRSKATRVYYGEQHWSSGTVYVDGITFVDGDVHLNGTQISGTGSLIATGNIHIDGSGIQYSTANDKVCIYAGQNLKINGSSVNIDGI